MGELVCQQLLESIKVIECQRYLENKHIILAKLWRCLDDAMEILEISEDSSARKEYESRTEMVALLRNNISDKIKYFLLLKCIEKTSLCEIMSDINVSEAVMSAYYKFCGYRSVNGASFLTNLAYVDISQENVDIIETHLLSLPVQKRNDLIYSVDTAGYTPLVHYIGLFNFFSNKRLINMLINVGVDLNGNQTSCLCGTKIIPSLIVAVDNYNQECINILLDAGANPSAVNSGGSNMLMYACSTRDITIDTLCKILELNIDINARDNKGKTCLHRLIYFELENYAEKIKLLIDNGVDVDAQDLKGRTPLLVATKRRTINEVQLLIDAGANINHIDKRGHNVFKFLVRNHVNNLTLTKFFIEQYVEIPYCHSKDMTLLQFIIYISNQDPSRRFNSDTTKTIQLFLENGENKSINKISYGKTALHMLYYDKTQLNASEINIGKMLIDYGADVNILDENGNRAISEEYESIIC